MTNKTDFRLWIVAAMAVLSPVLTVTFTRGQETQKISDTVSSVQQIKADFEKSNSEQAQINKQLQETLTQVRIAMERITTKIEIMESKQSHVGY